jgi:thiamine kinase-like enzyme
MIEAPQWKLLELLAATPVSRTWRVAVGGTIAVLRQDEPGAGRLGLNRVAEPDVIRRAAAAGLGPACLFADPGRGLLLTEWLPGRAWSAADLQEPVNLSRAAKLMRQVHATPLAGPIVDLGAAIDRYAAAAGSGFADLAAAAREQLARATSPKGAPTGTIPPLCFCHNDPTPANFIASPEGQLQLIDWEYAGLGHPGFDLAGLVVGANLNMEQVGVLLTAYRGRPPTQAELTRHLAWEDLCRSLGRLWTAACGDHLASI